MVFNGQNRRCCWDYEAIEVEVGCIEWMVSATFSAQRYCLPSVYAIICLPKAVFLRIML